MTDWDKVQWAERLAALEKRVKALGVEEAQGETEAMSAPTISNLHLLRDLKPNWDSHGAPAIGNGALVAASSFVTTGGHAVPTSPGGVQLEWHVDGWDIEIEFTPEGRIKGVLVARE